MSAQSAPVKAPSLCQKSMTNTTIRTSNGVTVAAVAAPDRWKWNRKMMNKMDENQFRLLLRELQNMNSALHHGRLAMERMAEAAEQTAAMQLEMLNHVTGGKTNAPVARRRATN